MRTHGLLSGTVDNVCYLWMARRWSAGCGRGSKPGHNQDDLNVAASFQGAFYVGGGYFSGRLTRDP